MLKEMRRSLMAAAFAGAALAGCGGGGSTSFPTPPAPASSTTIPTSAGSYFLAGYAGSTPLPGNIPYVDAPLTGASGFGLQWVDPSSLPVPFDLTTNAFNQLEPGGTVQDLAAVSEYFPSGGNATAWATRFRVYAKPAAPPGVLAGAGYIFAVDLRKPSTIAPGTTLSPPRSYQVSSGTISGLQLCSTPPKVFDNYRLATLSWIVFRAAPAGATDCSSLDDQFYAFQLTMTSSTKPKSLGQLEPLEVLYDATGTITGFLALNHPALNASGIPVSNPPLQQLDTSFGTPKTLASLSGTGSIGGDFQSLGVSPGNIWLYWDNTTLNAVNLTTGTATAIRTLRSGDVLLGRAVFDGTKAYVAASNGTLGSQVLQIDLANNYAVLAETPDTSLVSIRLVGVTSGGLIYFATNSTNTFLECDVKSTMTNSSALMSPTFLTATRVIDSLMGGPANSPPVAFLVGDTVYFTVADTGGVNPAKQAYYTTISASGVPAASGPLPVAASTSAVLGVVAPSPVPVGGNITYTGALVVTGGTSPVAGQAVFAKGSPAVAATLGLYGAGGTLANTIGPLLSYNVVTGAPASATNLANPVTAVSLVGGPVQAGLPTLLELGGATGAGAAEDIGIFSSDAVTPLQELSGFDQ